MDKKGNNNTRLIEQNRRWTVIDASVPNSVVRIRDAASNPIGSRRFDQRDNLLDVTCHVEAFGDMNRQRLDDGCPRLG